MRGCSKIALLVLAAFAAASAANATTIQTFSVSISGTITGLAIGATPGTVAGFGTATLDDSGVLTTQGTTTYIGTLLGQSVNMTHTGTNTLSGTLTGLTLALPYTATTIIDSCVDNFPEPAPQVCNSIPLGPPGAIAPGSVPVVFDITPGGTTSVFSVTDLSGILVPNATGLIVLSSTAVLTALPEPSSLMLLGACLAALVAFERVGRARGGARAAS